VRSEAGLFSLLTKMHLKDQSVDGHIKPFFKEMKVYDRKVSVRCFFLRMYDMLVGGGDQGRSVSPE